MKSRGPSSILRNITITTIIALSCLDVALAGPIPMTEDRLAVYVENVFVRNNSVVVKLPPGGAHFLYSIDKAEPKRTTDGQEIVVPLGSTLTLVEKHTHITFSPLPGSIQTGGVMVEEFSREDPKMVEPKLRKGILVWSTKAKNQLNPRSYRLIGADLGNATKVIEEERAGSSNR